VPSFSAKFDLYNASPLRVRHGIEPPPSPLSFPPLPVLSHGLNHCNFGRQQAPMRQQWRNSRFCSPVPGERCNFPVLSCVLQISQKTLWIYCIFSIQPHPWYFSDLTLNFSVLQALFSESSISFLLTPESYS
jgi:hypothetical protein